MSDGIELGPYRLQERLGAGGMGVVYRAVHAASRVPVAVKLVLRSGELVGAHGEALRHELSAAARLDHPHVARVLDMGAIDDAAAAVLQASPGSPYAVFELLDGGSLGRQGPFGWPVARRILVALLEALAHAHAHGVIHRDVKPQNLLLRRDHPVWDLKLTDFGIAWALHGRGTAGGTPGYMPPEQRAGQWALQGPPTDLYAAGRMALKLLTGDPNGLPALGPRVPDGFESWLDGLIAPDPADRWPLAADALAALERLGVEEAPLAPHGAARVQTMRRQAPAWVPEWRRAADLEHDRLDGAERNLFGLRPAPLVGRDREQQALWSSLEAVAREGEPQVRVVIGPRGSGRSRLADWVAARANELGLAHGIRGSGPAHHGGMAHAVRGWLKLDEADGDRAVAVAQSAAVRAADSAQVRVLRALALGEGSERDRAAEWAGWLAGLSADRAVLAILDGLDGDQQPARIAAAVRETGAPVLLILTAEPQAPWLGDFDAADHLVLDPLELESGRALVMGALPLDRGLAERIAARGEGLPGRLLGLAADLLAQDALVPGRTGLRLRPGRRLPGVEGGARLERLLEGFDSGAVRGLELASFGPGEIDPAALQRACAWGGWATCAALVERLVAGGSVRRERVGGPWRWADPALRERLRERAGPRSAEYHRAWAAVVAEPGDRGRHLALAADVTQALDPLLEGARAAHATDRFEGAAALLQAFEDAAAAAGLDARDARWGEARFLAARLAISSGRLELADRLATELEWTSQAHGWEGHRAKAWWLLGRMATFRGDGQGAALLLERALAWAQADPDGLLVARCRFDLGQLDLLSRRSREAAAHFEQAREGYRSVGFLPGAALAAVHAVHAAIQAGELERAHEAARVAGEALEAAGILRAEAEHALLLGTLAMAEGALVQAQAHLERAAQRSGPISAVHASAVVNLAIALDLQGRSDAVWPLLEPVVGRLVRMERARMLAAAWAVALAAAAALGDGARFDAALVGFCSAHGSGSASDPEVFAALQRGADRAERRGWSERSAGVRALIPPGPRV